MKKNNKKIDKKQLEKTKEIKKLLNILSDEDDSDSNNEINIDNNKNEGEN